MTEKKSWILIFAGEEGEGEGFSKRGFEGMGYMIMRRSRDRDVEDLAVLEDGRGGGDEVGEEDADGHCEEDEDKEEAVEEGEGLRCEDFAGGDGLLFGIGRRVCGN